MPAASASASVFPRRAAPLRHLATVGLACLVLGRLFPARAGMEPFVLPWNDGTPGITDFSQLNSAIGPDSRVTATPDGHFAVAGRRVRFLGMNFAGDAPFMPTNKAEGVAARLAKFGVNCVRFHHIDATWAQGGGLIRYTATGSRTINTGQLERIHCLVARLAAHGIHANLNLLTAREFRAGDGLGPEVTTMDSKDQHLLACIDDTALALQQEFATRLLTPTNRFTGLPLARDPAVAFVEVLNENGMVQKWYEGALDRFPAPYAARLQSRWNTWLAGRYADDAALATAWGAADLTLGTNLVRNGTFASGPTGWTLEQHNGATATAVRTSDFAGASSLKVTVTKTGAESWHVQLNQPNLRLTAGRLYTLTFAAKAATALPLDASVMMAHDPWQPLGFTESVPLETGWRTFTRSFYAARTDTNARVNFGGFGNRLATVWLADVRLQEGGRLGTLPEGTSLAARSVPNLRRSGEGFTGTDAARRDWLRFLVDLENRYYDAMIRHLRTEVGYPGLIFGTIMANSPASVQSRLDVIDAHTYWQHPVFPGTPWDPNNWTLRNASLLNAAPADTTLASLARQRLRGKPFTVTEYQHPSPNSYGAEGPLLLAAYAALQDWDGIWLFDYGWGNDAPDSSGASAAGRYRGYFDTAQHPTKMANVLLAANLFRRGDVQPARTEHALPLTPDTEIELLLKRGGAWNVFGSGHLDMPGALALVSRVAVDFGPNATGPAQPPAAPTAFRSDTGELVWNVSTTAGYLTFDAPRSKGALGFLTHRTLNLGDVGLTVLPGELGWATVGLTLVRGDSLAAGGTAVLVATGRCENTGQRWEDATRNSLSSWGTAPTLVETVPLRLTLPAPAHRTRAWVLDERGQRRIPALVEAADATHSVLVTRATDATLWYEIEIDPPPSASFDAWRQIHFTPGELAQPAVSGESATPAGDGIPNVIKYALGLEPKTAVDASRLAQWGITGSEADRRLWLAFDRRKGMADVTVETSTAAALPGPWTAVATLVEDRGDTEHVRAELPVAGVGVGVGAQGYLGLAVRRTGP